MRVKLQILSASVVDQKIYAAGVQFYALKNSDSKVLDTTNPQVVWDDHVPPISKTTHGFSKRMS